VQQLWRIFQKYLSKLFLWKKNLIENNRKDIASIIRSIQDNEKEKLQMTTQNQMLRIKYVIENEDEEEDPVLKRTIDETTKSLNEIINNIVELLEEIKSYKYDLNCSYRNNGL